MNRVWEWLARGWNERSFEGWLAWMRQMALLGGAFLLLEKTLSRMNEVPDVVQLLKMGLIFAAGVLLASALTSFRTSIRPLAALAGWTRLVPAFLLVPLLDRFARALDARLALDVWWLAPKQVFGWMLVGWNGTGFASLGTTLFFLGTGIVLAMIVRRLGGVSMLQASLRGAAIVLTGWLLTLIPSITAWTKLSSYGTTFAPSEQVVERAFARAWHGAWFLEAPARWLAESRPGVGVDLFVIGMMALVLLGVVACTSSLREKKNGMAAAAFLGGMLLALHTIPGRTSFALLGELLLATAFGFLLMREDDDETTVALSLIVAFLFGWGALLLTILALSTRFLPLRLRATAFLTTLFLLGSLLTSRMVWMTWSLFALLGLLGVVHVLLSWKDLLLSREKRVWYTGLWFGATLFLWIGLGGFKALLPALLMGLCGSAVLWLFDPALKRKQILSMGALLLLGILLHTGVFLP